MNPLLIARLMIALSVAMAGFAGGVYATRNHYVPIAAKMKLDAAEEAQARAQAISNAVADNDTLKTRLEIDHANAENALNILLDHPAGRVLLPKATCAAGNHQADSASGSAVSAATPERAVDAAQSALDDFTRGAESDAAEWSRALNACAVVMGWARGQ